MLQNVATNGNNITPVKRGGPGRPFAKGNPHRFKPGDPRCWRKGRPKSFDAVRGLAIQLAHEDVNGEAAIADLLRSWRDSDEPSLQLAFVAYAYGKVPDKLETTGLENKTSVVLYFDHEVRDNPELKRLFESNGR